jgi:UDP-3-O-[3-hydroxymyristoyl] N-acetylglucosamine deacetylase/3-hydroxyacyl-[acyl-carrier-protein] dehydratase
VALEAETSLDIRRLLDTMPHRYPFLLIDRVLEIKSPDELTALKNVTINEPYFQGHYPGNPVMPGVLQIEAMAQAAGVLMLRKISAEGKTALFMSCNNVKFRRAVRPGDQLVINVKMTKSRGNKIGVAEAECHVNGQPTSSAELMFAVVDSSEVE